MRLLLGILCCGKHTAKNSWAVCIRAVRQLACHAFLCVCVHSAHRKPPQFEMSEQSKWSLVTAADEEIDWNATARRAWSCYKFGALLSFCLNRCLRWGHKHSKVFVAERKVGTVNLSSQPFLLKPWPCLFFLYVINIASWAINHDFWNEKQPFTSDWCCMTAYTAYTTARKLQDESVCMRPQAGTLSGPARVSGALLSS